ncbi:hypothetical protein JHN57_11225, partial [Streptomyces sp. MBT59]|nr:hypothetical protein [Streptomyces sp. MBT59]
MTGTGGPRAAFREASGPRAASREASAPRAASSAEGPRTAFRKASAPRIRRLALALVAAGLLAGCATGTTEADPGTPEASSAASGTVAAPDPSRVPEGRTPDGTLLVADFGSDT